MVGLRGFRRNEVTLESPALNSQGNLVTGNFYGINPVNLVNPVPTPAPGVWPKSTRYILRS